MNKIYLAHRGNTKNAKENTRESIADAIGKFDGVEIDIRLTKDKKLAMIHDNKLDRVSNIKGSVGKYTLEELQKLDESIYSFNDFLNEYGNTFSYVNVDIKPCVSQCENSEQIIHDLMIKNNIDLNKTKYIFSSYAPHNLNTLKNIDNRYETALLISKKKHFKNVSLVDELDWLSVLDSVAINMNLNPSNLMLWSLDKNQVYKNAQIIILD